MAQILCLGDSITYGMWDPEGGWTARLRREADRLTVESGYLKWHEVFNLGVSGQTTAELLKRAEREVGPRLAPGEETLILIASGINDTCFSEKNHEYLSSPSLYEDELGKLAAIANKYTDKVLFVGLTPVDEAKTRPLSYSSTGKSYTNERIGEFNAVLESFCDSGGFRFIPVLQEWLNRDYRSMLEDGLHPNAQGHADLYGRIAPKAIDLI